MLNTTTPIKQIIIGNKNNLFVFSLSIDAFFITNKPSNKYLIGLIFIL